MRLYNTLTRREEAFTPSQGKTVRMYTCGLPVYARGHIGNFRTFVALDVLRRALEFEGYSVRQVRNYTDVDDRTIVESVKAGQPLREYTQQFVTAFERDAAALGLEPVEFAPRATDRSISRSRRFPSTAVWPASITPGSRAARVSTRTSTRKRTRVTSCSG